MYIPVVIGPAEEMLVVVVIVVVVLISCVAVVGFTAESEDRVEVIVDDATVPRKYSLCSLVS